MKVNNVNPQNSLNKHKVTFTSVQNKVTKEGLEALIDLEAKRGFLKDKSAALGMIPKKLAVYKEIEDAFGKRADVDIELTDQFGLFGVVTFPNKLGVNIFDDLLNSDGKEFFQTIKGFISDHFIIQKQLNK